MLAAPPVVSLLLLRCCFSDKGKLYLGQQAPDKNSPDSHLCLWDRAEQGCRQAKVRNILTLGRMDSRCGQTKGKKRDLWSHQISRNGPYHKPGYKGSMLGRQEQPRILWMCLECWSPGEFRERIIGLDRMGKAWGGGETSAQTGESRSTLQHTVVPHLY